MDIHIIEIPLDAIESAQSGYIERLRTELAKRQSTIAALSGERNRLVKTVQNLTDQNDELSRRNLALAAEAERAELAERQLEAADRRIEELEAALRIAQLPAESQSAVISMLRPAA